MTEKLYYNDAYQKEFTATVLSVTERDGEYEVVLDRTAFFPEEGGQYADRGYIGEARVSDVSERGGVIYHKTDRPLEVGSAAVCKIDFPERYEKMQCHTAEHILSGLIHAKYGFDNVGFHLGADYMTMDVSGVLTREQLDEIEEAANEVVFENVEVTARFPTPEELPELNYRAKLNITEGVRIVDIGSYDSCACCAPHVKRTGECGLIKILDFQKLRGGIRMFVTAGKRALLGYRSLFTSALAVSKLLSVPKEEIVAGVEKTLADLEAARLEFRSYKLSLVKKKAEALSPTDGNAVVYLDSVSAEELRAFAAEAVSRVGGILVALTGEEGDYKYAIASSSVDIRAKIKEINTVLSGRGGGSPQLAQGTFAASLDAIKAFFTAK